MTNNVTFTVNVDWGGHTPAKVLFITPKGTYEVPTTTTRASKTLNVGAEFGPCGKLKVRAVSTSGVASADKMADSFVIMSKVLTGLKPGAESLIGFFDQGDFFHYEMTVGTDLTLFDDLTDAGAIPEDFPVFGRKGFGIRFIPTVTIEITNNGEASYKLETDLQNNNINKKPFFKFLTRDYTLNPLFEIKGVFNEGTCSWNWGGYLGVRGTFQIEGPETRFLALPAIYFKPFGEMSVDAQGGFASFNPAPSPNFKLDVTPQIRLRVAAGVDRFLSAGFTGKGGADLKFQWPESPHLKGAAFFASVEGGIYGFLHVTRELGRCEFSLVPRSGPDCSFLGHSPGDSAFMLAPSRALFSSVTRDYLNLPEYGKFESGKSAQRSVNKSEQAAEDRNSIAVVQSTVFPYSEPHLSSGDSNVSLAWLYDNPQRTAINRSMAVSSRWNGAAWSEPQAFADDGTSDFHPRLLVFPDGSALAAWEDVKRILPDTAALADVVSNLEITASFYDPQLDRWSSAQRITANGYLDGSPRLAGTSPDDALLVWISNDQNDLRGGAAKPNTLWSAKWNGDV